MSERLFYSVIFCLFAVALHAGPFPSKSGNLPNPKPEPTPKKTEKAAAKPSKTSTTTKAPAQDTKKDAPKETAAKAPAKEAPAKEAPARAPENYRISANDLVEISVYREADLDTKGRVNEDGTITFPLLGTVKIGGLSVTEATKLLTQKLGDDYLVNPQVTLNVIEFSRRQFTVLGSVKQPGVYALPNNRSIDLLQAIASAGGFSRVADTRHVTVQRRTNGKDSSYKLDASPTQDGSTTAFEVQAGDTITVAESLF